MIYTITLNPAVDYIIEVDEFKLGIINRMKSDYKYPGGKGINVSRVLNNLNVKSIALGFLGGFTGTFIEKYLKSEGVETDFINVEQDTRINIKLKSNEETEINGDGPSVNEKSLEKLFSKIEGLKSEDFLVLSGNVQKTLPRDIYAQIQIRCLKNNVRVVVDTTSEGLLRTLQYKPFLIKPNIHELGELFNIEMDSKEKNIHYGKELLKMGAQNVIISMAAEGALLINKNGVLYASAPKGIVKNSVGAGDSLIAGFLANYCRSLNFIEAFKWGVAAGSATAFSIDLCKEKDIEDLLGQVNITALI